MRYHVSQLIIGGIDMDLIPSAENLFELEISFELYLLKMLHGIILLAFLGCFLNFAARFHLT